MNPIPIAQARVLSGALLALVLILAAIAPSVAAVERPNNWSCDDSGQLVCAGAEAGPDISCEKTRLGDETAEATCSWTYGQLLAATSPLGLPGEAAFNWSATITTCLTDAGLSPTSCSSTSTAGDTTCSWGPLAECIESQGPNPGQTDTTVLETGQCLLVEIVASGTAQAWTPTQDDDLAYAELTATNAHTGAVCQQNNGR